MQAALATIIDIQSPAASVKQSDLGALDDFAAQDVAATILGDFGADMNRADFVETEGRRWLAFDIDAINDFGSTFVKQVAQAVFAGHLAITPTRDGIGFRGL